MTVIQIFVTILILFPFVIMAIRKDFSDFKNLFNPEKMEGWGDIVKMIYDKEETELHKQGKEYIKLISKWLLNTIFILILLMVIYSYIALPFFNVFYHWFDYKELNWSNIKEFVLIIGTIVMYFSLILAIIYLFLKLSLFVFKFANIVDIFKLYFLVEFIILFATFSKVDNQYKGPIVKQLVYKVFSFDKLENSIKDKNQE